MNSMPWEIHPALTAERLAFLGRLIRSVRAGAVDGHEEDKGDTAWGLGCKAHERTLFAITSAASGIAADWLTVIEPGLHFVFGIGPVPVRFYRGEPESPPTKSLKRNYPEIAAQSQMAFSVPGFDAPASAPTRDYVWRIAIETDADGLASRVVLVEVAADDRSTRTLYEIPEADIGYVAPVAPKLKAGTKLPPPAVSLKSVKKDVEDDAAKADDDGES